MRIEKEAPSESRRKFQREERQTPGARGSQRGQKVVVRERGQGERRGNQWPLACLSLTCGGTNEKAVKSGGRLVGEGCSVIHLHSLELAQG